jgi:hypothetical protein
LMNVKSSDKYSSKKALFFVVLASVHCFSRFEIA